MAGRKCYAIVLDLQARIAELEKKLAGDDEVKKILLAASHCSGALRASFSAAHRHNSRPGSDAAQHGAG